MENIKFNALTPKVLDENNEIYDEALDYAFSNSDIKNIAITGIYGAGKSTVWNTYVRKRELNNVITVSLGKYENYIEDDDNRQKEVSVTKLNDTDSDVAEDLYGDENQKAVGIDDENRVEMQIINQILSQIDPKKIPLSKYCFKSNKSKLSIHMHSLALISMICSILLWTTSDTFASFVNESYKTISGMLLMFFCAILLFVPLYYFVYIFYRGNKFRVSKITFNGAEANMDDDNSDESVLDRDIKELVYLLESSGTKIVVFEDLDRYKNISIYTKLRELNFILNHYVNVNGDKESVRFIYMLKDGLFLSKNRTKFFDFILPIVPVVDSMTSENTLVELFEGIENPPDSSILADISLYVDDMRLLKNIVNEYIVYSKIIPLGQIYLESNKLFSLITLKNIFPNEFELLQEDKGFIRTVFDRLEVGKKKDATNLRQRLKKIDDNIEFLKNRIENDKFKVMALFIQSDIGTYYQETRTWAEHLKEWSKNPDERKYIRYSGGSSNFSYDEFINQYVLNSEDKKALVDKFPEDFSLKMNELLSHREKIKKQIRDIDIHSYKEIISILTPEQRDELFLIDGFDILKSHYFSLIRFLIVDGLLDETYGYYKGKFNVDTSNTLKRNDIIYMKGLKEGKSLDVFLDVETPDQIIERLNKSDFSRDNILNENILIKCLEGNMADHVMAMTDSVIENNKYEDLAMILSDLDLDLVGIYSDILINKDINKLNSILKNFCGNTFTGLDDEQVSPGDTLYPNDDYIESFNNILISIFIKNHKEEIEDKLKLIKEYVEYGQYTSIMESVNCMEEEDTNIFIKNIGFADVKFEDVTKLTRFNLKKTVWLGIERVQAYDLNVKNLQFVAERILEKSIDYGCLLNEICKSNKLSSSWNYIEDNFSIIIPNYIEQNNNKKSYKNDEEILLKILNSDISEEYKIKYVEYNDTKISELIKLQDSSIIRKIFDFLLCKNSIKFCSDNISVYWSRIEEYSQEFVKYMDVNLDENNYEDMLKNNVSLCNTFINDPLVSDKVFGYVIKYANEQVSNINIKLTSNRVNTLVHNSLIEVNEKNIEVLINNSYNEELTLLVNNADKAIQDIAINTLLKNELSDELIYSLVNSGISDENSLKLVNPIKDSILIEWINPTKRSIIKYIIRENLSLENINYVCKSFEIFELKDEFIGSLDTEGKLEELGNENLNDFFMKYVLSSVNIKIDTKLSLIETKVNNGSYVNDLKKYISLVSEIADLANVWEGKQPVLDNEYKEKIGQVLINSNHVKLRKYRDCQRIMLLKK